MTAAADAIILDRLRRYADRALKVRQLTALLAADADLAVAATLALLGRAGAGDDDAELLAAVGCLPAALMSPLTQSPISWKPAWPVMIMLVATFQSRPEKLAST